MKIILSPISHPEIGEISIEDTLFPIGRREEPFQSQVGKAVSKLSRRHARIFQEDGKVYIADMDSLNGTHVNDKSVRKVPAQLHVGDEINLGGELSFRVQIEDEADETRILESTRMFQPVRLMLIPVDANSGLEALVISQFPFLIARTDSVFGRHKERYPDDVRQISRRHAVFTLRGKDVYIEDLGSVNGTYVSGEKLDEHTRLLREGDVIAFGGDRFSYAVQFERTDREEGTVGTVLAGADETRPGVDESRTTFVNSATSFLDIFCAENDEPDLNADPASSGKQSQPAAEDGKNSGRVHRLSALAGEFREALDDGTAVDRRKIWVGFGLVALALLVAVVVYLLDVDRREIKELLDAGAYADSAALANRYLEQHPDDQQAHSWGLEALSKATVPQWIEHIERGHFEAAEDHLALVAPKSQSIRYGRELIDTLSWAGRVQAHIADRGGANAPIVLFKHDSEIEGLVEQWNANPTRNEQLLGQISAHVPSFEPLHRRVLSDLRALRNESALYGKAISELKTAISRGIHEGDYQSIHSSIDEFASKYPRVGGLGDLREDAERYELLAGYMETLDLVEISRFGERYTFKTPVFKEGVDEWLDMSLPPPETVALYGEAAQAWHAGESDRAIGILQSLVNKPWGDIAERQISQYERIASDYQALLEAREADDYQERLLSFRASLKPSQDGYFLSATEEDFELLKKRSLVKLSESLNTIMKQWQEYLDAGGIPGVVRVEQGISDRFKLQAERLSLAYAGISEGAQTYESIQIKPPANWQDLQKQIENETKRQRRWLEDLELVMEPTTLRAKLDLLPEVKETDQ